MALTAKQQLFTDNYLITYNATQAALSAGYSPKTAYSQGARLLKNVEISKAIDERLDESAMRSKEVLMRLADHARGDIGTFLRSTEDDEVIVDLQAALDSGRTHLIKKITQKRTVRTREDSDEVEVITSIELYDAQAALGQIGRHHGLFTDKAEITGKDGETIPIAIVKMPIDEL